MHLRDLLRARLGDRRDPAAATPPPTAPGQPLEVLVHRIGELVVLELVGDFDVVGVEVVRDVVDAVLHEDAHVAMDLAGVTFIDVRGLDEVLRARRLLAGARRDFALSAVSPSVRRLLELTGLEGELDVLDVRDPVDAVASR